MEPQRLLLVTFTILTLNILLPSTVNARLGETLAEAATRYQGHKGAGGRIIGECTRQTWEDTPLLAGYSCGCVQPTLCSALAEFLIEKESDRIVKLKLNSNAKVDVAFLEDILQKNSQGLSWTRTHTLLEGTWFNWTRSDAAEAEGNMWKGPDDQDMWQLRIEHPRYKELSCKKGQL